jgi:antitoxin component of MazEF toxin-antitoxin module
METTIKKIGNSHGVIIPSFILKVFGLKVASKINVYIKENQIIIQPIQSMNAKTLEELFKNYKGKYNHPIVFDDVKGDEIW